MKSSSIPDSLSQAQAHLLRGSFSHIHCIQPSTCLSLIFPLFALIYLPSVSQLSSLLHLIVLGVFNLSLLSARRIQYLSLLPPFLSFFCHSLLHFTLDKPAYRNGGQQLLDFKAYQQKTLQLGLTGVYKMADRLSTEAEAVKVKQGCSFTHFLC